MEYYERRYYETGDGYYAEEYNQRVDLYNALAEKKNKLKDDYIALKNKCNKKVKEYNEKYVYSQ